IIAVLRGSESEKITQFGHETLPTYGVGADRSQREWQGIIRQMVASGLLEIDISGYGGLRATATGTALMKGDGDFRFRRDRIAKEPGAKRSRAAAEAETLDADGARLLQRLKALRLDLARERGVPAYVVFSDKTLVDMAAKRPTSVDAFGTVFGVGAAKQKEFAEAFLAVVADDAAN
ncbi:MAG: RQC domain-containing protein, partial [Bauldia litoralis]